MRMKLALYQFAPVWGNPPENLRRIADAINNYQDVNCWILPELCTTGYLFHDRRDIENLAEPFPGGDTDQCLAELSRIRETAIVAGVAEKAAGKFYNSAVCYAGGRLIGKYRKLHLFDREKEWFHAGDERAPVLSVNGVKLGMMICFDWIFPEMARSLALRGAQLLAHPANLVLPYCPQAMLTRSIENRVFTATADRIGTETGPDGSRLTFIGQSQITDPLGNRLAQLSADTEEVAVVDIDPGSADDKSVTTRNDLFRDRRPDLYEVL